MKANMIYLRFRVSFDTLCVLMPISKATEAQFAGVLWDVKKVSSKLGVTTETVARWSAAGTDNFPRSIGVGPKARRWTALSILEWIDKKEEKR